MSTRISSARTIPEKLMSSFSNVVSGNIIFPNSDASAARSNWRVYSLQKNIKVYEMVTQSIPERPSI